MSYTSAQRSAIQQFVAFTQCPDKTAAKYLKNSSWNLDVAVDNFYNSPLSASSPASATSASSLSKIFDEYRNAGLARGDDPSRGADTMGLEASMAYLGDITVSVEDSTFLVLAELLRAPTVGEFARAGFIEGWTAQSVSTLAQMKARVPALRTAFDTDENDTTKRVYLYTYTYARAPNQKSLPLDEAGVYWRMLLGTRGRFRPHLRVWLEFLEKEYRKSIAKDTWVCMWDFVKLADKDPELTSYDTDGAWPSILDDFVEFWRRRGGLKAAEAAPDMEMS